MLPVLQCAAYGLKHFPLLNANCRALSRIGARTNMTGEHSMSWTVPELEAVRKAYASGTLRVSFEGRSVEYGSAVDLLSRIRTIEAEMQSQSGTKPPRRSLAAFGRG